MDSTAIGALIMVGLALVVLAWLFELTDALLGLLKIAIFAWFGYYVGHAVWIINYGKVSCK